MRSAGGAPSLERLKALPDRSVDGGRVRSRGRFGWQPARWTVSGETDRHRTQEDLMTATTTARTPAVKATECVRKRRRIRALATMAAAGATFTLWMIAHPIAGADLAVDTGSGPTTVTPTAAVLVTVVAGLAAWGLLALVERFSRRAAAIWSWIAGAVVLISLLGPLG